MAIANAIGSNIFDVLVGLGMPRMLTLLFIASPVHVGTEGLIEAMFLLSVTTIILYSVLYTGRQLTR